MLAARRVVAKPQFAYRKIIGDREVVGPCMNGAEQYYDSIDVPLPPIRYKPPTPESIALRKKEEGDWKSLTIDEKKRLYRLSFCQTFKEMEAPTVKKTVFPPLPSSMSDEGKKKMVRWYIDARIDPIDGISSKWDYEKNQWKEKPYLLMKDK